MQTENYEVVVVGAGVVGCSIAYHLALAGLKVALLDKGALASEASLAGAGMLAPLAEASDFGDGQNPFLRLCLAGLSCYKDLDHQLRADTGIEIELVQAPTLRPAFTSEEAQNLQEAMAVQRHLLPGLEWLEAKTVRETEPLLSPEVLGGLVSPAEWNVQGARLALAFAVGAVRRGAALFEGRAAGTLLWQGGQVIGIETESGPVYAEAVVLATGAWTGQWLKSNNQAVFPVKGQMLALQPAPAQLLRHTLYHHKLGYMLPKVDGSVYIGATAERLGFDKKVTAGGMAALLEVVQQLTPALSAASFQRGWAGLRPGSADELPLLGPSRSAPGLWLAAGHYRNGILLGPLTGRVLAALIGGDTRPFDLDLTVFDPDRFGGWRKPE